VINLAIQESTLLEVGTWKIEAAAPAFQGKVLAVEATEERSRLTIEGELPAGTALSGAMILVSSGEGAAVPYTGTEYYSVESVERGTAGQSTFVFEKQSLVDGYFHVANVVQGAQKLSLTWRNEVAGLPGSFAYQGRGVIPAGESTGTPRALIRNVTNREVELTSVNGITPGLKLKALTAKPGDLITMPLTVTVARQGDGEYKLHTTAEITVTLSVVPDARLFVSTKGEAGKELARAGANGKLVALLSPEKLGSGEMTLRVQHP